MSQKFPNVAPPLDSPAAPAVPFSVLSAVSRSKGTKEESNRGGQIGVRVKGTPRLKAIAQNTGGIKKELLIITGELITG